MYQKSFYLKTNKVKQFSNPTTGAKKTAMIVRVEFSLSQWLGFATLHIFSDIIKLLKFVSGFEHNGMGMDEK